jgi:LacI family transcriptional regulator
VQGTQINWVVNDYTTVSQEATEHLLALGHTRIGFVRGILKEAEYDRLAGIRAALNGSDLVVVPDAHDLTTAELADILRKQKLTALLCSDQTVTRLVLDTALKTGLRVPADLSIICLTSCSMYHPMSLQPTCVDMNRPDVGKTAVRTLTAILNGTVEAPQQIILPCQMVAGESTGPPSS